MLGSLYYTINIKDSEHKLDSSQLLSYLIPVFLNIPTVFISPHANLLIWTLRLIPTLLIIQPFIRSWPGLHALEKQIDSAPTGIKFYTILSICSILFEPSSYALVLFLEYAYSLLLTKYSAFIASGLFIGLLFRSAVNKDDKEYLKILLYIAQAAVFIAFGLYIAPSFVEIILPKLFSIIFSYTSKMCVTAIGLYFVSNAILKKATCQLI